MPLTREWETMLKWLSVLEKAWRRCVCGRINGSVHYFAALFSMITTKQKPFLIHVIAGFHWSNSFKFQVLLELGNERSWNKCQKVFSYQQGSSIIILVHWGKEMEPYGHNPQLNTPALENCHELWGRQDMFFTLDSPEKLSCACDINLFSALPALLHAPAGHDASTVTT